MTRAERAVIAAGEGVAGISPACGDARCNGKHCALARAVAALERERAKPKAGRKRK